MLKLMNKHMKILRKGFGIMKKYTANELLDLAIAELTQLPVGEKFILKDLFKGYVWNHQDLGSRRTLGSLFLNYSRKEDSVVDVLEKNSSNQQTYEKK